MAESAYVIASAQEQPVVVAEPLARRRAQLVTKRPSLSVAVQHLSPRESAALVFLSALLHAGLAYGFYAQDKAPPTPHVSKVDVEFARAPEPPKPQLAPPPPPPPPPAALKVAPVAKSEAAPPPAEEPSDARAPTEDAPVDSGSSAEAADDGNLLAGKGGLGVAPPPPAPPQVEAPPAKAPVIAAHEGANYSKNPRPGYPKRALREGWQGEVLVRVRVLPSGRAGQLKVQRSSGHEVLDEAALAAIVGWSFVPARQGGEPVAGWVTVPIVFRLQ